MSQPGRSAGSIAGGARARLKDPVSGLSHLAGLVAGAVGVAWLVARTSGDAGRLLAAVAYGASLLALYGASSAYHLRVADAETTRRLRLLDHAAIYLFVAGTATPVLHRALEGTTRTAMLAGMWIAAALGIALKVAWQSAPRAVYTGIYVAMGWAGALQWSAMVRALPSFVTVLVVAGGVVYTLGAVVYACKRPDPFPSVFGFHEIWHLFVLGGSALHFAAIALLAT